MQTVYKVRDANREKEYFYEFVQSKFPQGGIYVYRHSNSSSYSKGVPKSHEDVCGI